VKSQHLPSFGLEGQVAVVTGASRGIGRSLAEALAAAGATVAVTARSVDDAEAVAEKIRSSGGEASSHRIDVSELQTIKSAVAEIISTHHKIDSLVANAGIGSNLSAIDVTEQHWDEMFDVNLKGAFFTCQAVATQMIKQRFGRIVAISSQASLVGIRDHVAYSASKGGLNQMVRVLALEWGPLGINVNAVAPTFIRTPGTAERLDDPTYLAEVVKRIPVGHVGKERDVAGAVIYLCSQAGDLVNGSILSVDGGWTAQ